jgi:cell division protein FtsZ
MDMETPPRIKVIGVGDGGNHALDYIAAEELSGLALFAVNTHQQSTRPLNVMHVMIGKETTRGLGAGGSMEYGKRAALENEEDLSQIMDGADRVFIIAALGGGTGSGAAPIVAKLARASGAATIGVVSTPFTFEGSQRRQIAQSGLTAIETRVDDLITVEADRLIPLTRYRKAPILDEAFSLIARTMAWHVLSRLV